MKNSRFKYQYRKSASKLHRDVGDFIRTSKLFENHEIYQEYPVNKIDTSYFSAAHKYDWVILSLNIVIEVHGKQHFDVVNFGGKSVPLEEAIEAFKSSQTRDAQKKEAALSSGYKYVMIPYSDSTKLSQEYLINKIKEAKQELDIYMSNIEKVNQDETIDKFEYKREMYHQKRLELARKKRRERYLYLKSLK